MIGPFETKDLAMSIGLIIVISIAMYMIRSILAVGFTISLWILVILFVSAAGIVLLLARTILGYWKFGREGFIFAQGRKVGLPVYIDAELGSDNADFVLGIKDDPKDVIFKDRKSGVKMDPSLTSADARPMRFAGGLDVYISAYYNYSMQSIRNHAAFNAIKQYKDTKCPGLAFLSDKEFTELISTPEHYLRHDAEKKLNKYFKIAPKLDKDGNEIRGSNNEPVLIHVREFRDVDTEGKETWIKQDLGLPDLLNLIAVARDDIARLPVMGGYLAGNEAFKYNSVAYSAQHFSHAMMLWKQKMTEDWFKRFDWIPIGVTALLILSGAGFAIYIASMAFGK